MAWLLATCADSDARDPAEALKLAERAVKYCRLRRAELGRAGATLYRAQRWQEAVTALETADGLPNAPLAAQLIRAMASWQLGNQQDARQLFDRVAIIASRDPEDGSATSVLLAEAASLMGQPGSDQ